MAPKFHGKISFSVYAKNSYGKISLNNFDQKFYGKMFNTQMWLDVYSNKFLWKNSLRWKMYVRTWSLMVKFSEFNWSTCLCLIYFFYFTKICFLCWSIDGKFNLINIRNEKILLYSFVEMEEEAVPTLFKKTLLYY